MKHANRVEIPVNKALNVSVIQRLFVACCCNVVVRLEHSASRTL